MPCPLQKRPGGTPHSSAWKGFSTTSNVWHSKASFVLRILRGSWLTWSHPSMTSSSSKLVWTVEVLESCLITQRPSRQKKLQLSPMLLTDYSPWIKNMKSLSTIQWTRGRKRRQLLLQACCINNWTIWDRQEDQLLRQLLESLHKRCPPQVGW